MGTSPHQLFWGDQALTQERPLVVISKLLEDYRSQTDRQADRHADRQTGRQPATNLVHHKCPQIHLHHIAEMNKGAKAVTWLLHLTTFLVGLAGTILDHPKCPD